MRDGEEDYADQHSDIRSPQAYQCIPTRLLEVEHSPDSSDDDSTLEPEKATWPIKNLNNVQPVTPTDVKIWFCPAYTLPKNEISATKPLIKLYENFNNWIQREDLKRRYRPFAQLHARRKTKLVTCQCTDSVNEERLHNTMNERKTSLTVDMQRRSQRRRSLKCSAYFLNNKGLSVRSNLLVRDI